MRFFNLIIKTIDDLQTRFSKMIDLSWDTCIQRITNERIKINKEASLQLHFASILHSFGELVCIHPEESFDIELESHYYNKNIDITCNISDRDQSIRAAVELKCFRTSSKRAKECDMYDTLKDISRLQSLKEFEIKKFICLTDDKYYCSSEHTGHASIVSIKDGQNYIGNNTITPTWNWKNKSRNKPIHLLHDINFEWNSIDDSWFYLYLDL